MSPSRFAHVAEPAESDGSDILAVVLSFDSLASSFDVSLCLTSQPAGNLRIRDDV
jgi:hypothetical protein